MSVRGSIGNHRREGAGIVSIQQSSHIRSVDQMGDEGRGFEITDMCIDFTRSGVVLQSNCTLSDNLPREETSIREHNDPSHRSGRAATTAGNIGNHSRGID